MSDPNRYGNLQGSSLTNPIEPMATYQTPESTEVIETTEPVPVSCKINFYEFCSKNNLPTPTFKQAPDSFNREGYITEATWQPSTEEPCSCEPVVFTMKIHAKTRREAEGEASRRLSIRVKEWFEQNKPVEIVGNVKGELQILVDKYSNRFMGLNYQTLAQGLPGSSAFKCTLTVKDAMTGEHSTTGCGSAKRNAEKEAAHKMLQILSESLISTPSLDISNDSIKDIETQIQKAFPDYRLEYIADKQCEEGCVYLLKSCSLVLKRDDFPSIVVASCSGTSDEEAKLICAKLCVQYSQQLRELMDTK